MQTILLVVLMFAILIFPHELGHFIAARLCGVQVNEFSFGMGPTLYKKQGKRTLYSIRLFPIGGYCAMEGEDTEEADDNPAAFNNQPWWQKIFILVAGAAMNILIAFVLFVGLSVFLGTVTTGIGEVMGGSPAARAGLQTGDVIQAVEGQETPEWSDVTRILQEEAKEGRPLTLTVEREGVRMDFPVQPEKNQEGIFAIGIKARVVHHLGTALMNGARSTGESIRLIFSSLKSLFTSKDALKQVSGPVGIVKVVHKTAAYGWLYYLYLLALISINLAVFNILPLPALDGGRVIFVIIRLFTGKAISDKVEARVHTVGFILLLGLAVAVTYNDILNW